jgi:hypothetical protein
MAIIDSEKLDYVWKKIIYGVTKTANAATKTASNEIIASPMIVTPSQVWADGDSLPVPAPASATSAVAVFFGASRLQLTNDPTSPLDQTWIATSTVGDLTTRMVNFIPPSFDATYAVQVFVGDPNVGPAARIFPDTTGFEWVFDYAAGVLNFDSGIPTDLAATVGSGTVSVAGNGVYVQVYQYIGTIGISGGGGDGDLGTMSTQNANNVNITGGGISNVVLTNVTIDGGEF